MMMVSIVMPETGLRAVVAIALAATEVKKNEKSSVSTRPADDRSKRAVEVPQERCDRDRAHDHADQDGHDRDVAVGPLVRRLAAVPESAKGDAEDPATTRIDLRMPKMPAVAMAPTPMKRT